MTLYAPKISPVVEAVLWDGENFATVEEFTPLNGYEVIVGDKFILEVKDSTESTRWFFPAGTYIVPRGRGLRAVPKDVFESLYEELS